MTSIIIKWVIVVFALINAGYMTFDGARALIIGDYLRPASGEYAGQLGPWSKLVSMVGIDPESTLMKSVFLILGIVSLFITICFILDYPWAWKAMLIINICTLWNLIIGTASSIIQIILLIILRYLK
jgi:hypothetical protein